MKISPFDPEYHLGTVTQVTPDAVKANLPFAAGKSHSGERLKGVVGDFVFVESGPFAILGRIAEVRLPDRERLVVEPRLGKAEVAHPIGSIQLLATVNVPDERLVAGLTTHPRIGDRVFQAHPQLLSWIAAGAHGGGSSERSYRLGRVSVAKRAAVMVNPRSIFGRHCGVFGSTGGGKSFTLAKLLELVKEAQGKALLLDPTGEFRAVSSIDRHISLGFPEDGEAQVSFSYRRLTEADLFALLRPSTNVQGPKLRDAIKSLKLLEAAQGQDLKGLKIDEDGCLIKAQASKHSFLQHVAKYEKEINSIYCEFDISKLPNKS